MNPEVVHCESSRDGFVMDGGSPSNFIGIHVEFSNEMAQYLAKCYFSGMPFQEAIDRYMERT